MNYYIIQYSNENRLGKTQIELTPKDFDLMKGIFGEDAQVYRKIKNIFELIIASIFLKKVC